MPTDAYTRATRELAPEHTVLDALEIKHPALADPVRLVNDRSDLLLDEADGDDTVTRRYIALAFRARLSDDVAGKAPVAEIVMDNVGRELMQWVDAAQGGAGATVRVMRVLVGGADAPAVEWEVTTDVLGVRAGQRQVVARLGYDPMLNRPAVVVRYDPQTAPGLF